MTTTQYDAANSLGLIAEAMGFAKTSPLPIQPAVSAADLLDLLKRLFPQELAQAEGVVLLPIRMSAQQAMEHGGFLSLLETPQIEIHPSHPNPRALDLLALLGSKTFLLPKRTSIQE